ncbi:hypothetical protein [Mangrovibacterium lignilyticum]|uniref:hypothetical protein n=1 Tax=Mangrovibacterium lignilyticum TaxID=2668052 RepID=UPI0013CF7093|nr:hypothetical protein [Mangrovibacterium lignilyticum]
MAKIDEVIEKIFDNIGDLYTLNIKTVMGKMESDANGDIHIKSNQEVKGMTSSINLLDGDINTEMSEEFYQKYPELVQFHQSREAKGSEIIENNILTLKTIVETLFKFKEKNS